MSQSGRPDAVTAKIAAQSNRAQPYSLSTPRVNKNAASGASSSATRAEQRSHRGHASMRSGNEANNDAGDISNDQIMAAIARLDAKVEKEVLVLSDKFHQEIDHMSTKCNEDITAMANQIDEDLASMGEKIDNKFVTLSNQVEQVQETVDNLCSRQPAPANGAPGAAAATIGAANTAAPWMYSPELKAAVDAAAYESVALPIIAAYTKLETPNGDFIMHSLFNTVRQKIRNTPGTWATEQLPPVVNGVANVQAAQKYASLIKDAGKHAREKLHNLVLHNIKNNPEATVPCLKKLLHRIARQCGNTADGIDEDVYWAGTSLALRLRIAYLLSATWWQRREAIRIFQSRRAGGGGGNIWARVDLQLHRLSVQGSLYTSASVL
ncbi:uncharacterized protein MELLADRAFT_93982 [Melampsora larici-populina 98AG31]|uniref:Uncharacterized protein n=1 Tax=Melampsora larici-populina (strain 98AG31 / pathotype 3-4-7) TaxID=747676 RepID=F4S5Z6_MELLP|nr:uncharacterized protein MELLADRAFT_93982 [Melampsora larici-populina 98AG31]EGF99931.1 hypothetical protein MELLADRAFT_93982 [Melampsora larici-populina 98AG31]